MELSKHRYGTSYEIHSRGTLNASMLEQATPPATHASSDRRQKQKLYIVIQPYRSSSALRERLRLLWLVVLVWVPGAKLVFARVLLTIETHEQQLLNNLKATLSVPPSPTVFSGLVLDTALPIQAEDTSSARRFSSDERSAPSINCSNNPPRGLQ